MPASDLPPLAANEALPAGYGDTVERLIAPLAEHIAAAAGDHGPGYVVGLCGPQGSGKTAGARVLRDHLAQAGREAIVLSLDDLYLPLQNRQRLAVEAHPLLKTRGVPGTHDPALGLSLIESMAQPGETIGPRFDKATDDRASPDRWLRVEGPVDVILFEGWCVGARPQDPAALRDPINALERDEDAHGVWRRFVNEALATTYRPLFDRIDMLALLAAPSFDVVLGWRREQEEALRAARGPDAGMSDEALATFVEHYERLTRHILTEMPPRAAVVARLGPAREVLDVAFR
ncbi:MAG TPA: kinase [Caulobacteraceae bacterium]|nr:kinase [Caulobacteraceae bacterium]